MTEAARRRADDQAIEGWADIYERSASDLTRFATMLVGASSAEDVVADAVVAVLRSPDRGVEPSAPYLFRAVSNTAKNHWRTAARRDERESKAGREPVGPGVDPDEPRPRSELLELVGQLGARQRAVVFLTYWMDLSPAQVSDHLGIAQGSVKSHLARARHTLRGVLDV